MLVAAVVESRLYTLFSGGFDSFTYDSTGTHGTVDHTVLAQESSEQARGIGSQK